MSYLYDYPGWGTTVTIARNPAPTIEGGPEGRAGVLTFLISPLTQIGPFLTWCAGADETMPIAGGGSIVRRVPLRHPDDDEMYIESYSLDYFGTPKSDTWAIGKSIHTEQFSHARMTAYFRTLPLGVGSGQQFYTISSEIGASVETVPGAAMVDEDGNKLTGDRGWVVPCTNLVVNTYLSNTPVGYAIHSLVGRVNSVGFVDPILGTYPAGTLRFEGVAQAATIGTTGFNLTKSFNLKFREMPWNKVPNKVGLWQFAYAVGDGSPKYQSSDLNILKSA
jgi:hypothetical protein